MLKRIITKISKLFVAVAVVAACTTISAPNTSANNNAYVATFIEAQTDTEGTPVELEDIADFLIEDAVTNTGYLCPSGVDISESDVLDFVIQVFGSGLVRPGHEHSVWAHQEMVRCYFQPADHLTAMCVISYESAGNPTVIGALDERGLFQIHPGNLAGTARIAGLRDWGYHNWQQSLDALLDNETNIRAAADMVATVGWLPAWNAQSRSCLLK